MPRPWLAPAALAITIVAWASSFTAMRVALTAFSPAHVALLRYAVAAAVLLGLAVRLRVRLPRGADLARIAGVGAIGLGLYNVALAVGQRRLPAGTSSLLIATAPIWMALLALTVRGERLGRRTAAGLALGFAGIVLIKAGPGALGGGGLAIAITLGAAALQAVYSIAQRPLVARHGALAFLACAATAAVVLLLPTAGGVLTELAAAPPRAIVAVIFLGLVPGALGYGTWAYASTRVSTSAAGATLYLVPPVAMVIAFLFLGEQPSALAIAGGALVVGGVALARGR
jgi:drug/metabolite transporter (DMT)-like permease